MISSWTMTRRWAGILIAMMMIAVPAAASVITQNFMKADVAIDAACFIKDPGSDHNTPSSPDDFFVFNSGSTIDDPTGTVQLIQESMSVRGFAGDRLLYTDAVHFINNCPDQITVALVSENDVDGGLAIDPAFTPGSVWSDVVVSLYVATTATPAGNPGTSGEWVLMLRVAGGTVNDQINQVTIPEGEMRPMGVVVDTDDGVAALATGTLRWTAQATHP
jgi:hypothetical protein